MTGEEKPSDLLEALEDLIKKWKEGEYTDITIEPYDEQPRKVKAPTPEERAENDIGGFDEMDLKDFMKFILERLYRIEDAFINLQSTVYKRYYYTSPEPFPTDDVTVEKRWKFDSVKEDRKP